MKILIEPITKKEIYENADGLILSLKDYSVQSINYYTLEEIKKIKEYNASDKGYSVARASASWAATASLPVPP